MGPQSAPPVWICKPGQSLCKRSMCTKPPVNSLYRDDLAKCQIGAVCSRRTAYHYGHGQAKGKVQALKSAADTVVKLHSKHAV